VRANADKTIRFVINKLEGGGKIVNHKSDPGGLTKWGFSQKWNPDIDVQALDEESAVNRALERYWIPAGADDLTWPWDAVSFDCAFNFGLDDLGAINRTVPESWQDALLMRMVRHMTKSGANTFPLLLRCLRLYNWIKTQKE